MRENTGSEVLAVEQVVGSLKDSKSGKTDFVLLTNVAHIEKLLVVEHEELSLAVEVGGSSDRDEGPDDSFFHHKHTEHAGSETESKSIGASSDIDIVPVLTLGNVHPVLLDGGLVVIDSSLKNVLGEEAHAEVNGRLVFGWDTSVMLVERVEVILRLCVCFSSDDKRHSSLLINFIIIK